MNQINLISENYIKTHSPLMQNVDSQLIAMHISEAQNVNFRNLIGKGLFNRIINEFTTEFIDSGTAVSTEIVDLVNESQNYLLYRTLANSLISLDAHLTNKGIVQQNSENTINSTAEQNGRIYAHYSNFATAFGKQIIEYIETNISDFPEYQQYCASTADVDTIGLYLGSEI